jgi:HD-GYP domain-containing protein (c-di-GMP phosphodiesterase class II)
VRVVEHLGALPLERLCLHAAGILGVDEAVVFVCDPAHGTEMVAAATAGMPDELVGERFRAGGLAGLAMSCGQPLYVPDPTRLERPFDHPAMGRGRAAAAAPLVVDGRVRGVICVAMREESLRLGLRELELMGQLAALTAAALDRRGAKTHPSALAGKLIADLAHVDEETALHSGQVAKLARRVWEELRMPPVALLELELGARLHDVGKVHTPLEILRKPGPLSLAERDTVRLHAIRGWEMVAAVPGLEAASLIVRFHHERIDGRGYPDRLPGGRIPLASRIVAACDAFGAMTSERPYRGPLAPMAALREIERCAGSQFDPRVAGALGRLLAQDLYDQPLRTPPVELGVEHLLPRA